MQTQRIMSLFLIYLLIVLAVFLLQRKMIYFPDRYTEEQQSELLAASALQPWPDVTNYRGLISRTPISGAKGTVLAFHGNAGSAVHRTYFIDALQRLGYRVIVAEYPGYGARPGSPSESEFVKDGIETANLVLQHYNDPLYLVGESIGSGVVSGIVASKQIPVKGLLLITPFDSMAHVAQHHYWFFPAKWVLRDRYENAENLRGYNRKTAIILAEQDEIVPTSLTLALYDALPSNSKKLWRFSKAGHNTLPLEPWHPWWQEAMQFIGR